MKWSDPLPREATELRPWRRESSFLSFFAYLFGFCGRVRGMGARIGGRVLCPVHVCLGTLIIFRIFVILAHRSKRESCRAAAHESVHLNEAFVHTRGQTDTFADGTSHERNSKSAEAKAGQGRRMHDERARQSCGEDCRKEVFLVFLEGTETILRKTGLPPVSSEDTNRVTTCRETRTRP